MARSETITGGREATAAVIPGRYALSVGLPNLSAPKGWRWTPLSSVARLESGHTPSRRHPEYWGGSIPWVGIRDATGNHGRVIYETIEYTNELGIENSSARVLPKNTVCLSRTASVGYVVVMGRPMSTSQDFVNWICTEELNPHFLKYVLLAEREALLMFAVGSVHQTIYFPEAKAFHICMPDRQAQDAIVEILGALDDKIELNRRMNETLEAMARAIFKDWFVDFGPTRAKMAMRGEDPQKDNVARAPYLAPDIWSLFPDRLDDEGKPEGWLNSLFGAEFYLTMGQSPPGETYNETGQGLPFFQGRTDFGFRYPTRRKFCSAPTRIAQADDTLVSVRAPVGALNMAWEECCIGRGVAAVRHKSGCRSFTQYFLQSLQPEIARFDDSGSVFGAINKAQFERLQVLAPSIALIDIFEAIVESVDDRIRANTSEAETLAATRDLLLPKLMSGEVRIKDAEKVVGEAL